MPLSSLADAPSLIRPHTAISALTDPVSRESSQGPVSRRRIRSQLSIDALFVDDVDNRPGPASAPAANLEFRDRMWETTGTDEDLGSSLASSPSRSPPRAPPKTTSNRRAESLAALLGDQILEADLKSISYSSSAQVSDKQSRQGSQSKRVAFTDQQNLHSAVQLIEDNVEKPLLSSVLLSPPIVKRGQKKLMHEAPEKDDEWGATDVLKMLPDGADTSLQIEAKETAAKSSMYDFLAKRKPPSSKQADVDMSSDFGEYQPSFLSAQKRTPLAGRRRSPSKVRSLPESSESMEKLAEPTAETTYNKLPKKNENADVALWFDNVGEKSDVDSSEPSKVSGKAKEGENGLLLSRIASTPVYSAGDIHSAKKASLEVPTCFPDLQGTSNLGLESNRPPVSKDSGVASAGLWNRTESPSRSDQVLPESERQSSLEPQPGLEYQEQFKKLSLDTSKETNESNVYRPDFHRDLSTNNLPQGSNYQVFQNSAEIQRPAQYRKNEEDLSRREKAFCDVLLAERNTLQSKLDMEREKFLKEKETLQARFSDEGLRLQREIQLLSSAKEKVEEVRDSLVIEVKKLREENLLLKDEILRVENEQLAFEKRIYEAEQSHGDTLLNKVEGEREEAQKLALQLTSEVQLLKNSSLLAEEKMAYLYKLHDQEIQMIKNLHNQELEVKDKQFDIEKKLWSDHKTTMDTVAKLLEKGDEWAVKVDTLHGALLSEREHTNSDKTKWLETMDETVKKGQAALHEWGHHCNGIRNQFDQLLAVLESGGRQIRTMHLEEKDRLDKEHAHLKHLQEALQEERAQSMADLSAARERLEEMRGLCFLEKETFLTNCMQELKGISAEREAVVRMREHLLHAEAALERQFMEHGMTMQAEASESARQRLDLERAKEMAAEIAQEVDDARHELEQKRQAFEKERASVLAFGLQAQQKIESAIEIKREAVQLKLDAEAIHQESAREANEIERLRIQTAIAQKELLELKRRHDEERMRLAMERQQLCSKRKENGKSRVLRESMASEGSVYSLYDSKSQVFDLNSWDHMPKMKQARQGANPTRASHISSTSKGSLCSGPWIVESVEASLCLQAQEDFLEEASRVLQHTTQSTSSLLTKSIT